MKLLTNVGIVSDVLKTPAQYQNTREGFAYDRQKLHNDSSKTVSTLNNNIKKYGEKYSSQCKK